MASLISTGREGFEPSNTGFKVRGLTAWRPPISFSQPATSLGCQPLRPKDLAYAALPPHVVPVGHCGRPRTPPNHFPSSVRHPHPVPGVASSGTALPDESEPPVFPDHSPAIRLSARDR